MGPAGFHDPPGMVGLPFGTINCSENECAPGTLFLKPAQLPFLSFQAEKECDPLTATFTTPSAPGGNAELFCVVSNGYACVASTVARIVEGIVAVVAVLIGQVKTFQTSFLLALTDDGARFSVGAHVTKLGTALMPLHTVNMWEPFRSVASRVHGSVLLGADHRAARVTKSHPTPAHLQHEV